MFRAEKSDRAGNRRESEDIGQRYAHWRTNELVGQKKALKP